MLERLLPGQRVAASEWFQYMKGMLAEAGLTGFAKEPTLFRDERPGCDTGLVLHADDGLLASTPAARQALEKVLAKKVKVQISSPLKEVGDELEFLKRRYVKLEDGIAMYSGQKHVEALLEAMGPGLKSRDTPSLLEADTSAALAPERAKQYKECTGRLLYLSHTRPDIQYSTCVLASKMSSPTVMAYKWLAKVAGYLQKVPSLGFLIKPLQQAACLEYKGSGPLQHGGQVILESVTDADWAGCKRTRKSRSSVHLYLGGSLIASHVRTQKSVSLSSGESEFVAMVSGGTEVVFIRECLDYLMKGFAEIDVVLRSDSAAARGISQRIGCGKVRHLSCGLLWVQEAIKAKVFRASPVSGQRNPSDLGTKPLSGPRVRELLCRSGAVDHDGNPYGLEDLERSQSKMQVKEMMKSSGVGLVHAKKILPILLVMAQVLGADGAEGLGLAVTMAMMEDALLSGVATMATGLVVVLFWLGALWVIWWIYKWALPGRRATVDQASQAKVEKVNRYTQASIGMSPSERQFMNEYVDRCSFLTEALHEEHRTVEQCEEALIEVRNENRDLRARLARSEGLGYAPESITIATHRGTVYHREDCGALANSRPAEHWRRVHCGDAMGSVQEVEEDAGHHAGSTPGIVESYDDGWHAESPEGPTPSGDHGREATGECEKRATPGCARPLGIPGLGSRVGEATGGCQPHTPEDRGDSAAACGVREGQRESGAVSFSCEGRVQLLGVRTLRDRSGSSRSGSSGPVSELEGAVPVLGLADHRCPSPQRQTGEVCRSTQDPGLPSLNPSGAMPFLDGGSCVRCIHLGMQEALKNNCQPMSVIHTCGLAWLVGTLWIFLARAHAPESAASVERPSSIGLRTSTVVPCKFCFKCTCQACDALMVAGNEDQLQEAGC